MRSLTRAHYRPAALTVAVCALMSFSPSMASAKTYKLRSCGTIPTVTEGVQAREKITTRGYSCSFARNLIRRSNKGTAPSAWMCLGSGEGVYCIKTRSQRRYTEILNNPSLRKRSKYVRGDLTV